jgi:hypothetical protein
MSYEKRIIIQFLYKEKVRPTQIHRRLAAQYGLETYGLRSLQHWCQLSDCGRQNLNDDPRSGRLPIDHLDAKIIARLEREPFSSRYSVAEALDVFPATLLSRFHNSLGTKFFDLRWVPHQLTDDIRQVRVAKCGEILRALEAMRRTHFRHIIRGDESWLTSNLSTPHNGRPLVMKCLKGWAQLSALLSLCSRLFGAATASTC